MNEQQVEVFYVEVMDVFRYLEQQYNYQRMKGFIQDSEEGRDATAMLRYLGSRVGIEISWYFANATIDVAFIEVLQPGTFPMNRAFFGDYPDRAKGISLSTLTEMLGHSDDPNFLLKDTSFRHRNKRFKLIEMRMHDIIAGLARATQIYAIDIVKGDTSIFLKVMEYYTQKQKKSL